MRYHAAGLRIVDHYNIGRLKQLFKIVGILPAPTLKIIHLVFGQFNISRGYSLQDIMKFLFGNIEYFFFGIHDMPRHFYSQQLV